MIEFTVSLIYISLEDIKNNQVYFNQYSYLNREDYFLTKQAGHSVGVRPSPFPNLEVKPNVAIVLLRCESSWEVIVLAFYFTKIFSSVLLKLSIDELQHLVVPSS